MERWSIVVYRRHLDAFSIYAGSDFDIEAAVREEREQRTAPDPASWKQLLGLSSVLAKRHYHQTGALRWLDVEVAYLEQVETRIKAYRPTESSLGLLILALPSESDLTRDANAYLGQISLMQDEGFAVTVGHSAHGDALALLLEEFLALERIRNNRPELHGDAVARKEVDNRLEIARQQFAVGINRAFLSAVWYRAGQRIELDGMASLHRYASRLADRLFALSPQMHSELLNCSRPTGSAVAARRQLMYAMVNGRGQDRLGIKGYPAEGGLFRSLLDAAELYRVDEGISPQPAFLGPSARDPSHLAPLWQQADAWLEASAQSPVALDTLYQLWQSHPYGVKKGLLPVLVLAYVLSRSNGLAVYLDGAIRPDMDDFLVDRLLQSPQAVQIRVMEFSGLRQRILREIGDLAVPHGGGEEMPLDPLEVARGIVAQVLALPGWTHRTSTLSPNARQLRQIVKRASDPNRLLFDDLPAFASAPLDTNPDDIETIVSAVRSGLEELAGAYDAMMESLKDRLLLELEAQREPHRIRERARNVMGLTGDFRLDAFASRLTEFTGSIEDMEGLAGLAVNKPPRDWVDRDLDAAMVEIAVLAQKFNRSEAFARVKGRRDYRHAIAFVAGTPGASETLMKEFDINEEQAVEAKQLARFLTSVLQAQSVTDDVALAALTQVGTELIQTGNGRTNGALASSASGGEKS